MSNKTLGPPVLAFVLAFSPVRAIAQQPPLTTPQGYFWRGPWHMWSEGYGWPFAWWMCPLMMLVMIMIGATIWFGFIRGAHGGGLRHWGPSFRAAGSSDQSALQTLSERFARGEIEEDEYMQKKLAMLSDGQH